LIEGSKDYVPDIKVVAASQGVVTSVVPGRRQLLQNEKELIQFENSVKQLKPSFDESSEIEIKLEAEDFGTQRSENDGISPEEDNKTVAHEEEEVEMVN
jgi:hypothetical protein